jgi:hypothetical protein
MTERFYKHGDILHHVYLIEDPVYLTEPLIKTTIYRIMPVPNMGAYPCRPAVEIARPRGSVPHNPFHYKADIEEFAHRYNLPVEAVEGGAETALPEYLDELAAKKGSQGGRK